MRADDREKELLMEETSAFSETLHSSLCNNVFNASPLLFFPVRPPLSLMRGYPRRPQLPMLLMMGLSTSFASEQVRASASAGNNAEDVATLAWRRARASSGLASRHSSREDPVVAERLSSSVADMAWDNAAEALGLSQRADRQAADTEPASAPPQPLPPTEDEGGIEVDDEDPPMVAHALKYYNINDHALETGRRVQIDYVVYSRAHEPASCASRRCCDDNSPLGDSSQHRCLYVVFPSR
eukprot:16442982-Heterocapsa_arctica.AAC.4